jgi:DNA repair exonuclease SbcCD ATPase subunit
MNDSYRDSQGNKINKLRTPPRSPKIIDRIFFEEIEDTPKNEKCKIHIAEIYTLNKRIEKLNQELEEKIKSETVLQTQLEDFQYAQEDKYNNLISELNEKNNYIDYLQERNKILSSEHTYSELIEYYERKLEEAHQKSVKDFQTFTVTINKFSSKGHNLNRDEVWRNLIKKYEEKIIDLENQLHELNKNERKINCRQKFFEKYCFKAEEKIEQFSKVSKKFYDQENKINQLKAEIENYQRIIKRNEEKYDTLFNDYEKLICENEEAKKYVNKIKPILKINWQEIKKNNQENIEKLVKIKNEGEEEFSSQNVVRLIDTMNSFLFVLRDDFHQYIPDLNEIIKIVDDIKYYVITLLKKIQMMSINQYNIINTCCELNDKIINHTKNKKVDFQFYPIMTEIRNACSKLLFDYNPKKD